MRADLQQTKRENLQRRLDQQVAHARATGGCPSCLKPHDPQAPSCNRGECRYRWAEQCALRARTIGTDSQKGKACP